MSIIGGELNYEFTKGARMLSNPAPRRRISHQINDEMEVPDEVFGDMREQFANNQERKSQSQYYHVVRTSFEVDGRNHVYGEDYSSKRKAAFEQHIENLVAQIRAKGWTPQKKLRHNGVCIIADPEGDRLWPHTYKFITAFSVE